MSTRVSYPVKRGERRALARKRIFSPSIRAILLDCNGIIIDDEPIHLRLFQQVLREEGLPLSRKEYFERYLALDDKSCFRDVLRRYRRPATAGIVRGLIARKARYYKKAIVNEVRIFPGVKSFIRRCAKDFPLAVVSGALRHEIEWVLKYAGIRKLFRVIVSARDVKAGKPDPECYLKGFKALRRLPRFRAEALKASECAAIEDSVHGVQAAKAAGMKCVAVTNSYSRSRLKEADLVVKSLRDIIKL